MARRGRGRAGGRARAPRLRHEGEHALAEEIRLLYVALTRAEHTLHVTWAAERGAGAHRRRKPSPLLAAVLLGAEPGAPAPPPPTLLQRAPSPSTDPHALETLQAWRRSMALAADLPEDAICTDADLSLLAAARPSSEAELAELLGPLAARRLAPRVLPLLA